MINPVFCPSCKAPAAVGDPFCRQCGADQRPPARRPQAHAPPQGSALHLPANAYLHACRVCHHGISCGARACPFCGEYLGASLEQCVYHVLLLLWAVLNGVCVLTATIQSYTVLAIFGADRRTFAMSWMVGGLAWAWVTMWWAAAHFYGKRVHRNW